MLNMKKELSDKQKLIAGWENRIKHHLKQLAATRKFHREVEAGLVKKIKLERMQLNAIKKS